MPFVTSSVLGADFNNSSTTALFALGTIAHGSDGSEWQYVRATGTISTGMFVAIQADSTAVAPTTANLLQPTVGYSIGCVQALVASGEFSWVAKGGHNLIFACSGTVAPGTVYYLGATTTFGLLVATAGSGTMAGIYVTTSASTASHTTTARGILAFPRVYNAANTPIG